MIPDYCRARWADEWFEQLREVQFQVRKHRKDEDRKIKVAILDTGVDGTHEQIQSAISSGCLKYVKGFPDSLLPKKDKNGHGTHGASVLLKTAPDITLYVLRVSDDSGKMIPDNEYEALAEVNVCSQ